MWFQRLCLGVELLNESVHETHSYSRRRYASRRTPSDDPWNPRKRDIILFFVAIVLVGVVFLVLSNHWRTLGLENIAWSAWILGVILLFVSIGFACLFGIAFFTTDIFIRREVDRRVRRKEEEQRALMQRMSGRSEERHEEEED